MKVLSLCDGMSCGQIALVEAGIKYSSYYASEIDRHCIKQTQLNFPDTVQLGDIESWKKWDIEWKDISLVLAGTPCTGFSAMGKHLNFEDPQSRLFWVFADILRQVRKFNPEVLFLFENVMMKKEYRRIISETLGVCPVSINSALVSAQERSRYYWTNIRTKSVGLFNELHTDIPQPEDRGIMLCDILEDRVPDKYYASERQLKYALNPTRLKKKYTQLDGDKALPLLKCGVVNLAGDYVTSCGTHAIEEKVIRRLTPTECARLQTVPEWYKWGCSNAQIYKMLGNGWTIEVIKHILGFLEYKKIEIEEL
jgi:DNA (cytosine-5)-methyltransferase 3A